VKFYFVFLLFPLEIFGQIPFFFEINNLKPPYNEREFTLVLKINDFRIKNKLKPLKPHDVLNYHSTRISKLMSTKNTDTTLYNTQYFYLKDSLEINNKFLVDSMDFIGLSIQSHQYNCEILVISYDKRKRDITWVDLDCPKNIKLVKKRKR